MEFLQAPGALETKTVSMKRAITAHSDYFSQLHSEVRVSA